LQTLVGDPWDCQRACHTEPVEVEPVVRHTIKFQLPSFDKPLWQTQGPSMTNEFIKILKLITHHQSLVTYG